MNSIWAEARRRERAGVRPRAGWGSGLGPALSSDNGRIKPEVTLPTVRFLDGDAAERDGEQAAATPPKVGFSSDF
jgi:hypothetical protein